MKPNVYLPVFLLFLTITPVLAQNEGINKLPLSFRPNIQERLYQAGLKMNRLTQPDLRRIRQEDAIQPGTRFAVPMEADFGLYTGGTWVDLPDGSRLWRLQLEAEDALGLVVLYDDFYLPDGATLHMYSADRKTVLGPFTSKDNTASRKFVTGVVQGASSVLEYWEPASARGQGRLHIFRVDYAYHRQNLLSSGFSTAGSLDNELGFGASDSCHTNINCGAGADLAKEKRGVCRIMLVVQEGTGFCTGNLMNNTKQDGRPLMLTAFHCQDGYIPLFDFWRFDFNYESSSCENPAGEPPFQSIVGCTQLSGRRENDFLLLELKHAIPGSFKAYFLGWNRSIAAPSFGSIIHHPRGDIKKLSLDDDGISIFRDSIIWNNDVTTPPEHHFRSRFDLGSFDIGSSGAALLNQDRHVVGHLHGGAASCTGSTAYFGRLFMAWEGGGTALTRLKDWLDPEGTFQLMLDGMENSLNATGTVAGRVLMENGKGIANASVSLLSGGGQTVSTMTDSLGNYSFSGVPIGESVEISATKQDVSLNGCSVADLIKVQKHILNVEGLNSPFQWIASDVNLSRTISTLDLIQIRKVILGLDPEFKFVPAWLFLPANTSFPNAPSPFQGSTPLPTVFQLGALSGDRMDVDFIGVKYGDVNNSANPQN